MTSNPSAFLIKGKFYPEIVPANILTAYPPWQ